MDPPEEEGSLVCDINEGMIIRPGHGSDIRIFEGICDLFRMSRISNFSICFDSEKYGYSEKWISEN